MSATVTPSETGAAPSPAAIIDTAFAYQRTFALKAAVDCNVFTAIGEGHGTAAEIAKACNISERGARIVCDFMTTLGFLTKTASAYSLTPDAAMFLDRRSPAYIGSALEFLAAPKSVVMAQAATEAVRSGTTRDLATMAPEHDIWPLFAHAMASFMAFPAMLAAQVPDLDAAADTKILDIAAGHGEFGFAVARRFPKARIVAVDWKPVLAVARERAEEAGLGGRFEECPGDAFEVDYGSDYDLVLLPNFLHHFNEETNVKLLRKVAAALKPSGQVVIVDFVPNEDRVTPPMAARFSFTMLTNTQSGDTFTRIEFERMLRAADLHEIEARPLVPTPMTAIAARKKR